MSARLFTDAEREALTHITARVREKIGAQPSLRLLDALDVAEKGPPVGARNDAERKVLGALRKMDPAKCTALLEVMLDMQSE